MKTVLLLILTTISSYSQTTIWQTRMIQSQIQGAVGIPELVADNGERPSLPIGAKGSRFELWGIQIVSGAIARQELLDTTDVGLYQPAAEITITTGDPYTGFYRSRVDQPFTVSYKISNLLPAAPVIPVAAQKVLVEHYVDLYKADQYTDTNIEKTTLIRSFYLETNGNHSFSFPVTNLTAPDLIRRSGKERFIVYALADGTTPQREIAKAEIIMYPASEGKLVGLDKNKKHRSLPPFSAHIWRSYPGTSTWVEAYSGEFSPGKRGDMLPGTFETAGHITPNFFSEMKFASATTSTASTTETKRTLVLRASSPFPGESIAQGGRILAYETINVENTITVNSLLTTIE